MSDPLVTRSKRVDLLMELLKRVLVLQSHGVSFKQPQVVALQRVITSEVDDIRRANDARRKDGIATVAGGSDYAR